MAEPRDPGPPDDDLSSRPLFGDDDSSPVEEESVPEPAHPRRAASAEFIVEGETGRAGVMREAMDPANQSLAEALKLSYRVLQLVIVILLVLFAVSGFKSVEDSQTGVKTLFGRIQGGETEDPALAPGLSMSFWPYPAAEFIVFSQSGSVDLQETFWPNAQIGQETYELAAARIEYHSAMRFGLGSGRDGLVVLEDGVGHIQLKATYSIKDPVRFVENIRDEAQAREIVTLTLEQAVVHTAAKMRLDDAMGGEEVVSATIRESAQSALDDLRCGIQLERVQATNIRPPLAVHSALQELGTARSDADQQVADTRREVNTKLVDAAGENYEQLLALIDRYEKALLASDTPDQPNPEAAAALGEIQSLLRGETLGGEVAELIDRANAYQDEIRATLGAHAQRFASLYPLYQANPEFVVRRAWIETYERVLDRKDVEQFHLPANVSSVSIATKSDSEVMLERRKATQARRRREEAAATGIEGEYLPRTYEREMHRRLDVADDGTIQGRGVDSN